MLKPAQTITKGRVCTRCVMDETDPQISFNENGVCNHCRAAVPLLAALNVDKTQSWRRLRQMADALRRRARGSEYDCLIGLSGGVDSSYVAYLAGKLGLRPLTVHFDNGWNSEIAVSNIKNIVDRFGFDLATYVIDWEEFRDLQRAFFRASVIDIELLTDHAITASVFRLAREHNIRSVLVGANVATEFGMPRTWIWRKQDATNIRAIHRRYGEGALQSFPMLGTWRWVTIYLGLGYKYYEPLNTIRYRKAETMETLGRDAGWRFYGGKHYESKFTKFYQAYILPTKFGIDKRRPHLSALVRNGEMSRDAALDELSMPLYGERALAEDYEYVLKKLGFSDTEFEDIMRSPPVPHSDFPSDESTYQFLRAVRRALRR